MDKRIKFEYAKKLVEQEWQKIKRPKRMEVLAVCDAEDITHVFDSRAKTIKAVNVLYFRPEGERYVLK